MAAVDTTTDDGEIIERPEPTRRSRLKRMLLFFGCLALIVGTIYGAIWYLGRVGPPLLFKPQAESGGASFVLPAIVPKRADPTPPEPQIKSKDEFKKELTGQRKVDNKTPEDDGPHKVPMEIANEDGGGGVGSPSTSSGLRKADYRTADASVASGGEGERSSSTRPAVAKAWVDDNYRYKINSGREIPCITRYAANSQLSGEITCTIQSEIRGTDKGIMLIPKGSRAKGHVAGGLADGQNKIPILWHEIETSDEPPIRVSMKNPTADELGAPGMTMVVNDFFWPNLLTTAVYSLVDATPLLLSSLAQNRNSNSVNSFQFNQLAAPTQHLADRTLARNLQRPPVGEASMSKMLMIVINQDLDFSDAVGLRLRMGYQ